MLPGLSGIVWRVALPNPPLPAPTLVSWPAFTRAPFANTVTRRSSLARAVPRLLSPTQIFAVVALSPPAVAAGFGAFENAYIPLPPLIMTTLIKTDSAKSETTFRIYRRVPRMFNSPCRITSSPLGSARPLNLHLFKAHGANQSFVGAGWTPMREAAALQTIGRVRSICAHKQSISAYPPVPDIAGDAPTGRQNVSHEDRSVVGASRWLQQHRVTHLATRSISVHSNTVFCPQREAFTRPLVSPATSQQVFRGKRWT